MEGHEDRGVVARRCRASGDKARRENKSQPIAWLLLSRRVLSPPAAEGGRHAATFREYQLPLLTPVGHCVPVPEEATQAVFQCKLTKIHEQRLARAAQLQMRQHLRGVDRHQR